MPKMVQISKKVRTFLSNTFSSYACRDSAGLETTTLQMCMCFMYETKQSVYDASKNSKKCS